MYFLNKKSLQTAKDGNLSKSKFKLNETELNICWVEAARLSREQKSESFGHVMPSIENAGNISSVIAGLVHVDCLI